MARKISLMQYTGASAGWWNGTIVQPAVQFEQVDEDGEHDVTPIYRHGAKYGNGGFTGQRCMLHTSGPYAGRRVMFRMQDHLNRLFATLQALEWMKIPWNRTIVTEAMYSLMARNQDDDYLSLVFCSGGDVGVMPKSQPEHLVFINSRNFDPQTSPYLGKKAMNEGLTVRLTESDLRRRPPGPLAQAKVSSNYVDSNVAKCRAREAGCDDALILDYRGENIAELSVSNIIGLFGDQLVSPDASSGALNGITKQTVQAIATELHGVPSVEEPIGVLRLRKARMLMACGTAIGPAVITRVVDAEGHTLWDQPIDGYAADLAQTLCADLWAVLSGEEPGMFERHPEWYAPLPNRFLQEDQLELNLQ